MVATPALVPAVDSEELTYNISLFEASEISKKDMKKRVGTSTYMKLDSNEPFDTFVAQLFVRIERTFSPPKLAIEDYIVSFSIPRISPSPITLATPDDYNLLLERIKKNKDHSACVYVQQKTKNKVGTYQFITGDGTDTFRRSERTRKMTELVMK